jgi:methyl-accepting chemotaxis protein
MRLLHNLSIGRKLMLAPLVTIVLLVVGVAAGILALRHQQQALVDITQHKGEAYRLAVQLETRVNETYVQALLTFSAMRTNASEAVISKRNGEVQTLNARNVEDAARLGDEGLEKAARTLGKAMADTLELASVDVNAAEMSLSNVDAQFDALRKLLATRVGKLLAEMQQAEAAASAWGARASAVLLGILGASVVLSLLVTLLLKRAVLGSVDQLMGAARAMRDGDLTHRGGSTAADELGQAAVAFGEAASVFDSALGQARDTAHQVANGSSEIAAGNAELSARTERQAAALQQTAAGMSSLASGVRESMQQLEQANSLVQRAASVAQQGGSQMAEVVGGMGELQSGARRVQEIITVIDAIAFQTNILALNAAVEASRAGEHGRGFAVVAGEVRTLAQRSAQSAKEIRGLIGATVEHTGRSAQVVEGTQRTMNEIVEQARALKALMDGLAGRTREQTQSVEEVNAAIQAMDEDTQRNAALVEQLSASSASLRESSEALAGSIGRFRLSTG